MQALGIDIGGSGIKGALVDTTTGEFLTDRYRIETPKLAPPAELVATLLAMIDHFNWRAGPVGIGFPGVIEGNCPCTAVNLNPALVGMDLSAALAAAECGNVTLINDADAAGVAEMRMGAGRDYHTDATVFLVTVGTGLGTVLFRNGMLIPNQEVRHIEFMGSTAEKMVSERSRKAADMSWRRWGALFCSYLKYMEFLLQPNLIILGGGGVKKPERFSDEIQIRTPWTMACFGNRAGIIGAAIAATEANRQPDVPPI